MPDRLAAFLYGLFTEGRVTVADAVHPPDNAIAAARHGVDLARRSPEQTMYIYALACAGDVLCHHDEQDGEDEAKSR